MNISYSEPQNDCVAQMLLFKDPVLDKITKETTEPITTANNYILTEYFCLVF